MGLTPAPSRGGRQQAVSDPVVGGSSITFLKLGKQAVNQPRANLSILCLPPSAIATKQILASQPRFCTKPYRH